MATSEQELIERANLMNVLREEKIRAEIAHIRADEELVKLQTRELAKDLLDDDVEPVAQRILPFLGPVNEKNVMAAMYHLVKMAAKNLDPITIWFNSPGGYVVDGLALYDYIVAIRDGRGIPITTVALGEAASMAGILLQAGTTRLVAPHASILIHEVSGASIGKTSELEDELAYTKRLQKRLLNILAARSTLSMAQISRRWKKTDWWLEAEEAIELGFADGVYLGC